MKTYASLFSGFGGADIGAKAAGLQLAWGVEYDAKIAEVANYNLGQHIKVANLLDCDPMGFERVDVLHASPPCTRASVANNSAEVNEDGLKESPLDIALADKVIEFINVLQPSIVTIENVYAYRLFQSWRGGRKTKGIQQALYDAGYWLHIDHVNAADYQVPQTRKRMIVRAIRGGFVPYLPQPEPWIGWYEAIEDLIPTLPDSQFATWQLARLPKELTTFLVGGSNTSERDAYEGVGISLTAEPTRCVVSNSCQWRAFVVEGSAAGEENKFTLPVRMNDEPIFTMRSAQNNPRAFIVSGGNTYTPILTDENPCFTLTSSGSSPSGHRAQLKTGRVVSMTPRCLARFQSFPDAYILPESKALASKGIGNAVAPLMYQKVINGLVNA